MEEQVPSQATMAYPSRGGNPPAQVGRYRLLEKIGGGGMGEVFKARHVALNRIVAVKLLYPHRAEDKGFAARFWREMEAAGKLDHPNVVRATDAGQENDLLFLVMDLVEGIDLDKLVKLHHPLGVADVCEMVRQTALGLEAIRNKGMVHRDIKPSNLVLASDGVVKVLDLGLALLDTTESPKEELTPTGITLGTADYLAPEQAGNSKLVDIRSDLYSLGCTMHKLLTGRPPYFNFATWRDKVSAHCMVAFPPLGNREDVPDEVRAILFQLTAKKPEDRFQTPLKLAEALAPWTREAGPIRLVTAESLATASVLDARAIGAAETPSLRTPTLADSKIQEKQNPKEKRRSAPWRSIAILAAVIFMAFLIWRIWPAVEPDRLRDEPERKQIVIADSPKAAPDPFVGASGMIQAGRIPKLKWLPLLERPPKDLLWFPGEGLSIKQHLPDLKQLMVSTETYGVLGLADIDVPTFRVQIPIHQTRWTGGIGIVMGFRETKDPRYVLEETGKTWTGQTLILRTVNDSKLGTVFSLARNRIAISQDHKGALNHMTSLVCAQPIPSPQSEQVLEFHVAGNKLEKVRWGNTDLDTLTSVAANKKFETEDYQGFLAVFNLVASSTYRDARILVPETPLP